MRYFLRTSGSPAATGPYSVEEIETRLKAGEISGDALVMADDEGNPGKDGQSATGGWLCVHQLPGIGGNPAMRGSGPTRLPTSSTPIWSSGGFVGLGANCCPKCSAPMTAGETRCRKCDEPVIPTIKKPPAPLSLVVLILQVLGGLIVHYVSFIFVCVIFSILGGGYKSGGGILVLGGVIHCVGMIAYAIRLIRNPAEQGFGFGILIGALLSGLLTATCALSKYPKG